MRNREIQKGQTVILRDTEEQIEVEAEILAVAGDRSETSVLIRLAEAEEEALLLKIRPEQSDYPIMTKERDILGYGVEPENEQEWQAILESMEQESGYISD